MNCVELLLFVTCAAVLLSFATASPLSSEQRLLEVSPEEVEREREILENLRQQLAETNDEAPLAKRAQTFVRFGKRAQTFVRFGKRAQTFVRFGRSAPEQQ